MDEAEEKVLKEPLHPVKVIVQTQKTAVIEFFEGADVKRVIVPAKSLTYEGDSILVGEREIKRGLPYGVAWEGLELPVIDPEDVARILRKYGIWTREDARKNRSAMMSVLRDVLEPFIRLIIEEPTQGGKK